MPRRKKSSPGRTRVPKPEVVEHPTPRQGITAYARSSYKWAESYTSLLMGVVVIIIAVLFVVSLIRATHHMQDTTSIATGPAPTGTTTSTTPTPQQTNQPSYTVQPGDNLWSISEKTYGSGYNWVDIAQANNIANPSTIFAGNHLVLPQVTPSQNLTQPPQSPLSQIITQQDTHAIIGNSYTVVTGDTLWDIAVRAYADGYKWTQIAQANNLSNPDLIFSGNILIIPR